MPFHCDDERTDGWAFETLEEIMNFADRNEEVGKSLVEIVPAISFKQKKSNVQIPAWALDTRSKALDFQHLTVDELYEQSRYQSFRLPKKKLIAKANYSDAWLFQAPIVDSPKMLQYMLDEVQESDCLDRVDIESGKYYATIHEMVEEAKRLGCDGMVNCTGLGSRSICNDETLVGARGVLLQYDRSSCVWSDDAEISGTKESVIMIEEAPFGTETEPCYTIPRGPLVVVGGTYLLGDEEKNLRPQERKKVLENARLVGIDTSKCSPSGEWVGFRPYRQTARLEVDTEFSDDVKVIHNFGYGGSGWTVYVGAAKEAASLLSQLDSHT